MWEWSWTWAWGFHATALGKGPSAHSSKAWEVDQGFWNRSKMSQPESREPMARRDIMKRKPRIGPLEGRDRQDNAFFQTPVIRALWTERRSVLLPFCMYVYTHTCEHKCIHMEKNQEEAEKTLPRTSLHPVPSAHLQGSPVCSVRFCLQFIECSKPMNTVMTSEFCRRHCEGWWDAVSHFSSVVLTQLSFL